MEPTTKVFLINWIILMSVVILDKHVLDDKLEEGSIGALIGCWCGLSMVSIPAWAIWMILS